MSIYDAQLNNNSDRSVRQYADLDLFFGKKSSDRDVSEVTDIPEGKTPSEVAALAWSGTTNTTALSGTIVPWAETEMVKASIIGDEFAKIEEDGK